VREEWEFGPQCHPTERGCGLKRKFEGKYRDSNQSVSLLRVDADWASDYFCGFPDDMGTVIEIVY
jgi:hypothetical protein